MLLHKILQNHLLRAFVANLKIDAIYELYPESFCDKNLAIRKVFTFCDSVDFPVSCMGPIWNFHFNVTVAEAKGGQLYEDMGEKSSILQIQSVCLAYEELIQNVFRVKM